MRNERRVHPSSIQEKSKKLNPRAIPLRKPVALPHEKNSPGTPLLWQKQIRYQEQKHQNKGEHLLQLKQLEASLRLGEWVQARPWNSTDPLPLHRVPLHSARQTQWQWVSIFKLTLAFSFLFYFLSFIFYIPSALSAGKKPVVAPPAQVCQPTDLVTPMPVREVVLQPVSTRAFRLPNGATIDLTADLDLMLQSAVASIPFFSPIVPHSQVSIPDDPGALRSFLFSSLRSSGGDPCQRWIEIRAGVSSFILDAWKIGVSFGYTPSGAKDPADGFKAKTQVRIGTLAMDVSVLSCNVHHCAVIDSRTASATTAGVDLTFDIHFGETTTSPGLVWETPLGEAFRKVMTHAVKGFAQSKRLVELPWKAQVKEYLPEIGAVVFDQGFQSRLGTGQSFTVFAQEDESTLENGCGVYRALAHVKTTQVEAVSSVALLESVFDSRPIRAGDWVMVRPTVSSPASR